MRRGLIGGDIIWGYGEVKRRTASSDKSICIYVALKQVKNLFIFHLLKESVFVMSRDFSSLQMEKFFVFAAEG